MASLSDWVFVEHPICGESYLSVKCFKISKGAPFTYGSWVFQSGVFEVVFRSISLCGGHLRASFPFLSVLWFSWAYSLKFSKPGILGACPSCAVSMHTPMQYVCLMWNSNPLLFRDNNHTFVILLGPRSDSNFLFAMTTFHPSDPRVGLWFKQAKQRPALGFYKGY